ncbi:Histidine kinase [Micromonospora pallida]|uniref:histidine kinase n=1 Tax=Micromonospora pallida TaxID=145854 RepID=A0A1C6THA0_9ACTN|nr:sensor histidine kinase [Micromonospora pallida]SCL40933.1 Histidine kinase [Micromonospora pallida]
MAVSAPVAPPGWSTTALRSFGLLTIVAGLAVHTWSRVPWIGWFMVLAGGLYHLGDFRASGEPALFAAGFCLAYAWTSVLTHIALAVPTGRTRGHLDRILVAGSYLASIGTQVGRYLAEHPRPPLWWHSLPPADSTWADVGSIVFASYTVVVLAVVLRRWLTSSRARRRPAGPLWAAIVVVGLASLAAAAAALVEAPAGVYTGTLVTALVVDLLIIPLVVLARRLRSGLAQGQATRTLLELERPGAELPNPAELERALAEAVGDPTLAITYPAPDGSCPDIRGRPVAEGPDTPGRTVSPMLSRGVPVAWVEHDELLGEQREVTEAAFGLAALAIENARLHRAQQRQIEELRRSRLRVSTAAFEERQRIQRDLHDGTQQRLYAVLLLLDTLRAPGPAGADRISGTADRAHLLLRDAIAGLRDLTRGMYPAALLGHGLAAAVGQLVEIAPVPIEVRIPAERWPSHVELTAYFFIAEGLANTYKHARADRASVTVRRVGATLTVDVCDDGRGGATPRPGSGLTGLLDRVAAAGGAMTIDSPPAGGTRLSANLRLEDPCE